MSAQLKDHSITAWERRKNQKQPLRDLGSALRRETRNLLERKHSQRDAACSQRPKKKTTEAHRPFSIKNNFKISENDFARHSPAQPSHMCALDFWSSEGFQRRRRRVLAGWRDEHAEFIPTYLDRHLKRNGAEQTPRTTAVKNRVRVRARRC